MNRKLVLALGVVVAAAIAVWWWRGRSAPEGDGGASKPPVTTAAPKQLPGPAGREARTGELDVSPRVLIDDDPKGTLRLEGQVVDADDHPVTGATVVLASNPPRTTVSEADGGFTFDALVGRPYSLIARGATGIAGPVTTRLTDKSDPVVLKLRPAAKLTVTVTGAGGKPVDGATVELRGVDEQRETTRGGKAVFASVVPGGYQVAAWSAGMARALQWIQVAAGDADVKIALIAGAAVAGRVVDERGAGVAGARVRFSGASDWSQQASDRLDAVESAADGTFEFPAIGAGTFRFLATHADKAPGASALITLDGKLRRDGVTITVTAGAVVRGRVVDGAKHGVAARVRIGTASGPRAMIFEAPRQVYADASGRFEIKGLPRRALQAIALADTGASQAVPVDTTAGDVNDVTLAIDITGSIAGVVVDPQGQPMEGVQVSAGPNFSDNKTPIDFSQWRLRGFPQELTDATGRFTLNGLAAGTYSVSAMPAASASRGRRGAGEGTTARTGDTNLRLVLAPEGGVKGKVAFADGTAPALFSISVGMTQQSFGGDGAFALDALPPQKYELSVRGPSFQTRAIEVVIESGKTADAGTITVVKGRSVGGHVVADGQPVAGATVYAGRQIFGNGTSSAAGMGNPMAQAAKHETTDEQGAFAFAGFGESDVTIVAEHEAIGRSRALRLPAAMPGQTELTLVLEKFGSLTGVLRQGGKPAEGVLVTCQSTSTPGALYAVASGADGAYRFDKLAPDVYKVSATVGMPMTGMRFYSKQVEVPPGKQITVDLTVEPGSVTFEVTVVPRTGTLGVASVWLATGTFSAKTASELQLKSAAAGPGASQLLFLLNGGPARFTEVMPGTYSVCTVPFPAEIHGFAAMGYTERHGDTLPAYCKTLGIAAAPASQALAIPVDLPPLIVDDKPPGGGSGSQGSGSQGSGSGG